MFRLPENQCAYAVFRWHLSWNDLYMLGWWKINICSIIVMIVDGSKCKLNSLLNDDTDRRSNSDRQVSGAGTPMVRWTACSGVVNRYPDKSTEQEPEKHKTRTTLEHTPGKPQTIWHGRWEVDETFIKCYILDNFKLFSFSVNCVAITNIFCIRLFVLCASEWQQSSKTKRCILCPAKSN